MGNSARTLAAREIAWRRLANQHLITPLATPLEVVRSLGAVQSQDYIGGKWGIGQRTIAATDSDIERELTAGTIVRTHVLRPTWHFVAAEDIRWMLALTGARVRAILGSYDKKLGIDAKVLARSETVLTKALAKENHLTRLELRQVLEKARIGADGTQRLAHIVMHAEQNGLICSGLRRGKQSTYALVDERLPAVKPLSREDSLKELARRYFLTRGPATVHDFSWWSGLTVADARRGLESVQPLLEKEEVNGRAYWFAGSAPSRKTAANTAHLLPNYDEYFIGLKDRSAMSELVKARVVGLPGDTFVANVVAVGGQLAGGWTRVVGPRSAKVVVRLVTRVTREQVRATEAQVERYSEFLGLPLKVEYLRS
jgi:hypothetical protein